jgi:hypothetical protein
VAYVFIRDYDLELLELNKDMYHVYVESHVGAGGERKTVFLRQHERGLPLTLRNNFSDLGALSSETEKRDITTVEAEIGKISRLANSGVNVCVPLTRLTNEFSPLERLSPKLAGYLLKRLASVGMRL